MVESLDVLTEEGSDQFDDAFYLPAETNPRQLKEEDRLRLLRLFGRFDRDGNNRVSQREIRIGLTEFGNPPTKAEADQIISQLDLKRGGASDGFVDFEEFALGLLHRRCLLYKALYERHALSGTPASVDEPMDTAERTALSKLRNKSDARAHLSAVISAQTGRRATNFV